MQRIWYLQYTFKKYAYFQAAKPITFIINHLGIHHVFLSKRAKQNFLLESRVHCINNCLVFEYFLKILTVHRDWKISTPPSWYVWKINTQNELWHLKERGAKTVSRQKVSEPDEKLIYKWIWIHQKKKRKSVSSSFS